MGRTLLGIELDESPFGGLVERLLDEEDLEKLDARPDGGADPGTSGGGSGADDSRDGEGAGGSGDGTGSESGAGVDRSPAWRGDDGMDTPSPDAPTGVVGGEGDGECSGGWRDRVPSFGSRFRRVLLIVAGLGALVAVLALVAWRYGDRIASALPDRLRRDGSAATGEEEGVDAAGTPTDDGPEATSDDDEGGAAVAPDDDVGALVALAFLALVAALVRKVTEDPPRDPLVDGDRSA